MAGIYLHIPFCKSRCVYCDFFSTLDLHRRQEYVAAMLRELAARRSFLPSLTIDTIYFGGGTPSLLPPEYVEQLLARIRQIYNVREGAEITLEANPDDLTPSLLWQLRHVGVNRLSVGVQTFSDSRLRFLRRRHTAEQAVRAIDDARRAGFDDVSIDLMFGFPDQTLAEWQADVEQALALGVQHLSAYSLMYEEHTPLGRMLERGEVREIDDLLSLQMYEHLLDAAAAAGFEHYEISNFALPGYASRHNSGYWHSEPYLGVGAGAHSYDGTRRCFNADSLDRYLLGDAPTEEPLTTDERYDEYVFTSLRTSEGLDLAELQHRFGAPYRDYCVEEAQPHLDAGRLTLTQDCMRLTRAGLFVSNDIMSDLMRDV